MEWSTEHFIKYNDSLNTYESCGIFPNFRKSGYHLAKRIYPTFDKPEYETVKFLTDFELINALDAKIPNWGFDKIKIRVKCISVKG